MLGFKPNLQSFRPIRFRTIAKDKVVSEMVVAEMYNPDFEDSEEYDEFFEASEGFAWSFTLLRVMEVDYQRRLDFKRLPVHAYCCATNFPRRLHHTAEENRTTISRGLFRHPAHVGTLKISNSFNPPFSLTCVDAGQAASKNFDTCAARGPINSIEAENGRSWRKPSVRFRKTGKLVQS